MKWVLTRIAAVLLATTMLATRCETLQQSEPVLREPVESTDSSAGAISDTTVTVGTVAVALYAVERSQRTSDVATPSVDESAALEWMASLGLLTGTTSPFTTPGVEATRGDIAVILHRFAGSPSVATDGFPDVTRWHERTAVAWMRNVGLTNGTSPTTYSPDRLATPDEFDSFLDRLAGVSSIRLPYGVAHTVIDDRPIADPFIVPVDDGYILYATQDGYVNLPVWRSDDLRNWEWAGEALPVLPAWATWGKTWAPDVFLHDGRWNMFFTALAENEGNLCIGHAVADSSLGPFIGDDEPMVCQHERGGAIDPRVFTDVDGRLYLHWKSDDNHLRRGDETILWAQELDDDLHFIGPRTQLMGSDDGPHLGPIVESPHMVENDGHYDLTYSAGGGFLTPTQFIGTARCEGPLGPCFPTSTPLIASNDDGPGPGEHSLFRDHDGTLQIAYGPFHSGHRDRRRVLAIAELRHGQEALEVVTPDTDS